MNVDILVGFHNREARGEDPSVFADGRHHSQHHTTPSFSSIAFASVEAVSFCTTTGLSHRVTSCKAREAGKYGMDKKEKQQHHLSYRS